MASPFRDYCHPLIRGYAAKLAAQPQMISRNAPVGQRPIGAKLRNNRFEDNSLVFINTVLQRGVYGPPISKTVSTVSFGARKTVKTVEKHIASITPR